MQKGAVACGGMVVGLVFLVIALLGPWYTMNGGGVVLGTRYSYSVDLFLTQLTAHGTMPLGQTISYTLRYVDAMGVAQNAGINPESFTVVSNAMYLTVAALITGVVACIGMVGFVVGKGTSKLLKYLGGGFGMVSFILAVVPAWYFMSTRFVENSPGFWFSESVAGATVSGGPGYAWYLLVVAAAIMVISAIAILLKKISPETATPEKAASPTL